ncbi:AAA family ATPase [Rhodanobacter aciditrophus]|uniref:AAA family ATPase n=1 Tax=Rhodanobacter aciditrophus TaxID=1623218 RepID=A0ABW4B4G5_9GAMM
MKYRKDHPHSQYPAYLSEGLPSKLSPREFCEKTERSIEYPDAAQFDDKSELLKEVISEIDWFRFIRQEHYELFNSVLTMLQRTYQWRYPTDPSYVSWMYQVAMDPKSAAPQSNAVSDTKVIVGPTGFGKSTMVTHILTSTFEQVVCHDKPDFKDLQIVYLMVRIPHDANRAELIARLLFQMDTLIAQHGGPQMNYAARVKTKNGKRIPIAEMINILKTALVRHHVGLILFDDVQHIEVLKGDELTLMKQLFDEISNDLKIPHIKVGTPNMLPLFQEYGSNLRRLGRIFEFTRIESPEEINELNSALFNELEKAVAVESLEEVKEELWFQSAGIPATLFDLLRASIDVAISTRKLLSAKLVGETMRKEYPHMLRFVHNIREKNASRPIDSMTVNEMYQHNRMNKFKRVRKVLNTHGVKGPAAKDAVAHVENLIASQSVSHEEKELLKDFASELKAKQLIENGSQTIEGSIVLDASQNLDGTGAPNEP